MTGGSPEGRRILITGVAGFIGFHAASRLLRDGAVVHGLDNLNGYYDVDLKTARLGRLAAPGFSFEKTELADAAALARQFDAFAPDAVIHLAAQAGVRYSIDNPQAYAESNLTGFLNVLEACRQRRVGHLIYASSSSVYGASATMPFSEDDRADRPVSLYGATKRANELMAHSYAHLYALPATGLRFFTVYGPWGRPDMAYFSFTRKIAAGEPIDVFNEGRMERDFTYIDDVVDALVALIDRAPERGEGDEVAPHRVYNIGNHTPVTLDRFIAAIEDAVGRRAVRRLLPMQPGDVPATYADVDRLAAAVGFSPRTSIEEGLRRFVEWYRGYYDGSGGT